MQYLMGNCDPLLISFSFSFFLACCHARYSREKGQRSVRPFSLIAKASTLRDLFSLERVQWVYHLTQNKMSPRDTTADCKTCTSNHIIYVHFLWINSSLHRCGAWKTKPFASESANLWDFNKIYAIQNE